MKVAITSDNNVENSPVSAVGARAEYFLIFDGSTFLKAIKNPFKVGGGAGFAVASLLADEGVSLVVSQNFGEKMISSLEQKNIQWKKVDAVNAQEALDA